jgi:tRNA threonylcarbamoyladenosine biosynthesis protein TsaB
VILAFDTATRATAVAVDGLELRDDPPPGSRPRHTTRLLPLIAEAMSDAGARWDDIERIAVGIGPGTFTGLRIGIATARALGRARGIPLVGVSTLESLAVSATPSAESRDAVLAVLDARRGEVFAAAWPAAENRTEALLAPRAIRPEALAELIPSLGPRVLAIGEGAVEFRAILERSGARIPDDHSGLHRVAAKGHIQLGRLLRPSGPDEIRPEYLRLPDAELARAAANPSSR